MAITSRVLVTAANKNTADSGVPTGIQIVPGNADYSTDVAINVLLDHVGDVATVIIWYYNELLSQWGILATMAIPSSSNPNYFVPFIVRTKGQTIGITVGSFTGSGHIAITALMLGSTISRNQ